MKNTVFAILFLLGFSLALAQVTQPEHTVEAEFITASATEILEPGQKIADLYPTVLEQDYILQRISERSYWVMSNNYASVFYVGHRGVVVFDPVDGVSDKVLTAISSVTLLPVTTVVYSHSHVDHIGGIAIFQEAARAAGVSLNIIATQATAEKLAFLNSILPEPTTVLDFPNGEFTFENLTVQVVGFEHAAHTNDHAAFLLVEEKVVHAPDLMNPDQLPFMGFAVSENFTYFEANLKQVEELDWDVFSGGHGNIDSRDDFIFTYQYIDDANAALGEAMGEVEWVVDPKDNSHAFPVDNWMKGIIALAHENLSEKYGAKYGYEVSNPRNLALLLNFMTSYR